MHTSAKFEGRAKRAYNIIWQCEMKKKPKHKTNNDNYNLWIKSYNNDINRLKKDIIEVINGSFLVKKPPYYVGKQCKWITLNKVIPIFL